MKIPEQPFGLQNQEEVKALEITDPEVDKFFFELAPASSQSKKNLMIGDKYREILEDIAQYTEEQILQYASVFLKFSSSADFYAGKIMKAWNEQPESTKKKAEAIQKEVEETTQSMRSGVLENVEKTTEI